MEEIKSYREDKTALENEGSGSKLLTREKFLLYYRRKKVREGAPGQTGWLHYSCPPNCFFQGPEKKRNELVIPFFISILYIKGLNLG